MGYRSEVCLVLTAEGEQQLRDRIAALPDSDETAIKMRELLDNYPDTSWRDQETGATIYHWESLKWYNTYMEVIFLDKFFADADSNDYLFFRIGEDDTDISVRGNYWDNPYAANIYRCIDYQLPMPKTDEQYIVITTATYYTYSHS